MVGKLLKKYHQTDHYSPDIEHRKNIKSIQLASKRVTNGGLVIIYPGRRSETGKWFDGVGYLVKGVKNPHTKIFFIYAQGTSSFDILRLLPYVGKLVPRVHVYFSKCLSISDITNKHPKEIRKELENKYDSWVIESQLF